MTTESPQPNQLPDPEPAGPPEPTATDRPTGARRFVMLPIIRLLIASAVLAGTGSVLLLGVRVFRGGTVGAELAVATAVVMSAMFVGLVIERRRPWEFGFAGDRAMRDVAIGFLAGGGAFTLAIAIMAAAGWYRITGFGPGTIASQAVLGPGENLSPLIIRSLFFFLVVAVFEETFARGLIFRITEEGLGSWAALVISSLLFGLPHLGNPHSSLTAGLAITIEAGLPLAAAYMLTRNLWMPIGIHWAWNLFEGPIWGTAVSGGEFPVLVRSVTRGPKLWTGGSFGPEAGLVVFLIGLVLGLVVLRMAIRKGELRTPAWLHRSRSESSV